VAAARHHGLDPAEWQQGREPYPHAGRNGPELGYANDLRVQRDRRSRAGNVREWLADTSRAEGLDSERDTNRYPLGLDAIVFKSGSGSIQTMSWTNDTPYPVLMRGYKIRANGLGYVRFVIYSIPNGRKVVISNPIIKNVRPAFHTVVYTSTLAPGVRERVEFPVDGKDVWRTVTVYQNGKVIHSTTYYSHYSRVTGLTLIGR
jgi:hypothetical protein